MDDAAPDLDRSETLSPDLGKGIQEVRVQYGIEDRALPST
jgi:hypothetical protein